jgi:hypothetical protein
MMDFIEPISGNLVYFRGLKAAFKKKNIVPKLGDEYQLTLEIKDKPPFRPKVVSIQMTRLAGINMRGRS